MKKIFTYFIFIFFIAEILIIQPAAAFGKINYELIYEDMPILDFMYESGVDPEESGDYEDFIISPYVLVRLPVMLQNKKKVLYPGYYLVKPEKRDGYRFVIFKQKGRVRAIVPIYKKYRVNPLEVFPEPEEPKHSWYVAPFVKIWDAAKWPFKKLLKRRKPLKPPRAKAEFEYIEDGNFYDMKLYIEDSLYKMLFKLVIPE